MTRPLLFICALALVAIIGCGGDGDAEPAACVSTTDAAIEAAARAHVKNVVTGDGESTKDGRAISADRVTVKACRSSDDDAQATVTVEGLRDDSVRDVRHAIVLKRRDGRWTIARDGDSYRCQEGRGQQDFEPRRCV